MQIIVSSNIKVIEPTPEIYKYCQDELTVDNEEYLTRLKQNKWIGNTPPKLQLYIKSGNDLILPFGSLDWLWEHYHDKSLYISKISKPKQVDYSKPSINAYDYQESAIQGIIKAKNGILQSPAGSGKSFMALEIIRRLGYKALFIAHTLDLVKQAKNYAIDNFNLTKEQIGEISQGKINVGSHITFATRQTLAACNLQILEDEFDIIVVDECHNIKCNQTQVSQYTKILSTLKARYKIGISATVDVKDINTQKMITALIGNIKHNIPKEAVADKVIKAKIKPIYIDFEIGEECLTSAGVIDHNKYLQELTTNKIRNNIIANQIKEELKDKDNFCIVLSERVEHLKTLHKLVGTGIQIDGSMVSKKAKAERQAAIEKMRNRECQVLFASYQLAKEGLNIVPLNRLFLATPQADKSTIIQAVGRIERAEDGKQTPIVFDFVDKNGLGWGKFNKRKTIYKRNGNLL